jgi:hypothetical protein
MRLACFSQVSAIDGCCAANAEIEIVERTAIRILFMVSMSLEAGLSGVRATLKAPDPGWTSWLRDMLPCHVTMASLKMALLRPDFGCLPATAGSKQGI